MSETEVQTEVQIDDTDNLDMFSTEFFGEKKVPVEAAKPDVEQDDVSVKDESDTEAQKTDDQEDDLDAEIPAEELTPKKKTFQDRINELVKQREDEKRIADARIEQIQKDFDAKIAALQPKPTQLKTTEPQPDTLNEDGTPKYALGEFDPLYIRDLTRFTLEQERAQANIREQEQRQVQEQIAQKTALMGSWNEKMIPAKEKYPDLQEKGQVLLDGFSNLNPEYAEYLGAVLMSMDYGPDVLYYLSNNRDEATKIVNSGAQKATLALGRIEAKFAEVEAQKLVAKPKVSKAPPPPTATARGTGGGSKTIEPDTDDLDAFTQEFFRKRK